jgi:hypothetical protein
VVSRALPERRELKGQLGQRERRERPLQVPQAPREPRVQPESLERREREPPDRRALRVPPGQRDPLALGETPDQSVRQVHREPRVLPAQRGPLEHKGRLEPQEPPEPSESLAQRGRGVVQDLRERPERKASLVFRDRLEHKVQLEQQGPRVQPELLALSAHKAQPARKVRQVHGEIRAPREQRERMVRMALTARRGQLERPVRLEQQAQQALVEIQGRKGSKASPGLRVVAVLLPLISERSPPASALRPFPRALVSCITPSSAVAEAAVEALRARRRALTMAVVAVAGRRRSKVTIPSRRATRSPTKSRTILFLVKAALPESAQALPVALAVSAISLPCEIRQRRALRFKVQVAAAAKAANTLRAR